MKNNTPIVIEALKQLTKTGVIQIHSEPWFQSVLSYFVQKELEMQTELHEKYIQAVFGQPPRIFIIHSALNTEHFNAMSPFEDCNIVVTSSNFMVNNRSKLTASPERSYFLINHILSRRLQLMTSNDIRINKPVTIDPFRRYIRKHVSLVRPLVLVYDPLLNDSVSIGRWEEIMKLLMEKENISFYSLSDLEEITNYFSINNHYSKDMMPQFFQEDYWLKNKLQQEAFRQLININRAVRSNQRPYVPEAWYYLQDLNNYFHMNDGFFLDSFSRAYFTPYRSPHEAFTSYMNAISNFWNVKNNNTRSGVKSSFPIVPTLN